MLRVGLFGVLLVAAGLLGYTEPALAGPKPQGGAVLKQYAGGPPPWAPAHGYRRKFEGQHHDHRRRAAPSVIDLDLGRCNRELIGAVLGGAAGGVLGAQIGSGPGRVAATAGGVLIGAVIGGAIGRRMDERDRACVAHALDLAPHGRAISWDNPESGVRYALTPLGAYQADDGRSCREFITKAVIDGRTRRSLGVACRQPDGAWQRPS